MQEGVNQLLNVNAQTRLKLNRCAPGLALGLVVDIVTLRS